MIIKQRIVERIISLILVISIIMMSVGCSNSPPTPTLPDPNPQVITENVKIENIVTENELHEYITSEIYLEEIVLAEEKITELLLEEETISEVLSCQTIYVAQEHLEDFAENSQTAQLFGEGINIKSLLTKVAIGTGVIVTVVVLKKVGLPEPISEAVIAAADESLKFAKTGAALGSLFGGLTGATDELDETGRTSAVIGFAVATVGLIISAVSLITAIPSGGTTTITLGQGIKLVIAGIGLMAMTATTAKAGYNAVKTFQATDATDIDWNNVDWEKVGVSSAEKAIENAADGYMWGAIVGAVHGGAEGFENYHKHSAPYSTRKARIDQTPKNDEYGHWSGERGESDYIYDKSKTITNGNKTYEVKAGAKVTYKNAIPDYSPYEKAQVKISNMTNNRAKNFRQADNVLADYWTKIKYNGQSWTRADVEDFRVKNGYTWHEMNNMESMQLVPSEVNAGFGHLGGVGEYNVMTGQEGVSDFD